MKLYARYLCSRDALGQKAGRPSAAHDDRVSCIQIMEFEEVIAMRTIWGVCFLWTYNIEYSTRQVQITIRRLIYVVTIQARVRRFFFMKNRYTLILLFKHLQVPITIRGRSGVEEDAELKWGHLKYLALTLVYKIPYRRARAWPSGRVRARAKESCIQLLLPPP